MRVVNFNDLREGNAQRKMDEFVLKYEDSFAANRSKVTDKGNYLVPNPFKIRFNTQN